MCASAAAQTVAPFKDGDRAVFLGNSITDGGHYHSYIWLYYMTRFPYMDLRVMNAGIGGETAGDMYKRLDGDVLSKRPTVLTVTFGMNDTGYMELQRRRCRGIRPEEVPGVLRQLQEDGEAPANPRRRAGRDARGFALRRNGPNREQRPLRGKERRDGPRRRIPEGVGRGQRLGVRRFQRPDGEIGQRIQAGQPSFSLSMGDRIHPDNDGHMVMAYLYLKAQGFAGREVADVQIDAAKAKVLKAGNCEITGLRRNGREISFDYLAEALPYPLDTLTHGMGSKRSQAEATKLVPFIEEMNREMLTVKGLKGDYTLHRRRADRHPGQQTAGRRHQPRGAADAAVPARRWGDAPERVPLGNRTQLPRLRLGAVRFLSEQGAARRQRRTCRERARRGKKEKNIWLQIPPRKLRQLMLPHVREARARSRWNCSWRPSTRSTSRRRARSYCARTDPGRLQAQVKGEADADSPCFIGCSPGGGVHPPHDRGRGRDLLLVLPQRSLVGPAQREQLLRLFGGTCRSGSPIRCGRSSGWSGTALRASCSCRWATRRSHCRSVSSRPGARPTASEIEVQHVVRRSCGTVADQRHDARPSTSIPEASNPHRSSSVGNQSIFIAI